MSLYHRGMQQVIEYESDGGRLFYTVTDDSGQEYAPDAAPEITIYTAAGSEKISAATMTVLTAADEGWLAFDGLSPGSEYSEGATLTGGTSSATGYIRRAIHVGTAGWLYLTKVEGTFQNDETITDSESGSATADQTLTSFSYYYDLDISDTTTWTVGTGCSAKITYDISSKAYTRRIYFDVAFSPMVYPIVTTDDIAELHPNWILPNGWVDWRVPIKAAHAELVRRIHDLDQQAAHFVRREDEFFGIELALVEHQIAMLLQFPMEERDYYRDIAAVAWTSRGQKTYDSNNDVQVDSNKQIPGPSQWSK